MEVANGNEVVDGISRCAGELPSRVYALKAYEVLTDEKKRAIYDRFGEEGLKNGMANGGGEGGFHDPFDMFAQYV